ncbi:MAG: hypothetical protein H6728_16310 [Myxococcales bacterium]|nr:hypothetical protein [Myxococcales bacterium]MCB9644638.1 hypothetical protein [Myxococcales bacterium]
MLKRKVKWDVRMLGFGGFFFSFVALVWGCGEDSFLSPTSASRRNTANQQAQDMRDAAWCGTYSEGSSWGGSQTSWGSTAPQNKEAFMRDRVLPVMQSLFRAYDPERFGEQGAIHCQTCHGKPKSSKDPFSSPSVLFPLDPTKMPTKNDPNPKIAKAVAFMESEVMPRMEQLLGSTMTCFSCHAARITPISLGPKPPALSPSSKDVSFQTTGALLPVICPSGKSQYNGDCVPVCRHGECPRGSDCKEVGELSLCVPLGG